MGDMADMYDGFDRMLDGEGDSRNYTTFTTMKIKYVSIKSMTDKSYLFRLDVDGKKLLMWIPKKLCKDLSRTSKTVWVHDDFYQNKLLEILEAE